MKNETGRPCGVTSLMAVFVLSLALLCSALALSSSALAQRFSSLRVEQKSASLRLAEACLSQALLHISLDYRYAGNEVISSVVGGRCQVGPVTSLWTSADGLQRVSLTVDASLDDVESTVEATVAIPSLSGDFVIGALVDEVRVLSEWRR